MLGEEIRPGLWRWTAFYEEWKKEVAAVAAAREDQLVLIDPLLVDEQWDQLGDGLGSRQLHVLLTIHWHARSAGEIAERFDGARIWANSRNRALIVGDALLGDGENGDGLHTCPAWWLPRSTDLAELRAALDLPIEVVLPSHGAPVLAGGKRELARATAARAE